MRRAPTRSIFGLTGACLVPVSLLEAAVREAAACSLFSPLAPASYLRLVCGPCTQRSSIADVCLAEDVCFVAVVSFGRCTRRAREGYEVLVASTPESRRQETKFWLRDWRFPRAPLPSSPPARAPPVSPSALEMAPLHTTAQHTTTCSEAGGRARSYSARVKSNIRAPAAEPPHGYPTSLPAVLACACASQPRPPIRTLYTRPCRYCPPSPPA